MNESVQNRGMGTRERTQPRQLKPELERDYARSPDLGYETADTAGFVRCLSHGFPTPLARWHYHDEYELHLITSTSGKAFVGDWIGPFQPGHLVLTGPRLPHNWLSLDTPDAGVELRDLVIQFQREPLMQCASHISELAELDALLERACHGVEFFDMGARAEQHWHHIKSAHGLRRLTAFLDLMCDLAACTYRRGEGRFDGVHQPVGAHHRPAVGLRRQSGSCTAPHTRTPHQK